MVKILIPGRGLVEEPASLMACRLCEERKYGQGPVRGSGNLKLAKVCLLGRNPGVTEDTGGEPFIGRAGKKLDEGCAYADLRRLTCYIDNISKCMTPKDVSPSASCRKVCGHLWLNPALASMERLRLIVTLGNQALQYFEPLATVGELHGTAFSVRKPWLPVTTEYDTIKLFVSYHPSAALRSTQMNKYFLEDMKRLYQLLTEDALRS